MNNLWGWVKKHTAGRNTKFDQSEKLFYCLTCKDRFVLAVEAEHQAQGHNTYPVAHTIREDYAQDECPETIE